MPALCFRGLHFCLLPLRWEMRGFMYAAAYTHTPDTPIPMSPHDDHDVNGDGSGTVGRRLRARPAADNGGGMM